MLAGVTPFPAEFAARYRERGYWTDRPLFDGFRDALRRYADQVALVDADGPVTYRQLDERSNRLAHVLRRSGLRTGDHLALDTGGGPLARLWATALAGKVDFGYVKSTGTSVKINLPKTALMGETEFEWRIPQWSNTIERDRARTYFQAYAAAAALYFVEKALQEVHAGRTKTFTDFLGHRTGAQKRGRIDCGVGTRFIPASAGRSRRGVGLRRLPFRRRRRTWMNCRAIA